MARSYKLLPPNEDPNKRSEFVGVYLRPDEKMQITLAAQKAKSKSLSEFIRETMLHTTKRDLDSGAEEEDTKMRQLYCVWKDGNCYDCCNNEWQGLVECDKILPGDKAKFAAWKVRQNAAHTAWRDCLEQTFPEFSYDNDPQIRFQQRSDRSSAILRWKDSNPEPEYQSTDFVDWLLAEKNGKRLNLNDEPLCEDDLT